MLKGKKIVLGVTGGIAAYKIPFLVRLLVKEGAEVKVVLTEAAKDFVTTQTLSVLSKNKVIVDFFDTDLTWNNHVHLANWADILLIAPLTANTLAKMTNGICDNLLLTIYFSASCKVVLVPAMDLEMYRHPVVKRNLDALISLGHTIIPAEHGELASGLVGEGRMAEPETILLQLKDVLLQTNISKQKTALVNAGPTYEPIDQVRFIGNRSSGKMGIAIAEELSSKGFTVTLVLGPTSQTVVDTSIKVINVETADEMYAKMLDNYENKDLVICSAAVSDYKPGNSFPGKIKKMNPSFQLELIKNTDILLELGKLKKKQFLVGFALETENLLENAKQKLKTKNLDLIIANLSNSQNKAFNSESNNVVILGKDNILLETGLNSKKEIASSIVSLIQKQLS